MTDVTPDERELLDLVRLALADAYPGRELAVELHNYRASWLQVIVTEYGLRYTEPIARHGVTYRRLRDLRDQLMGSLILKLGPPRRERLAG